MNLRVSFGNEIFCAKNRRFVVGRQETNRSSSSRFKRSLNVILVGGSQFYSLLLRGSLKTKETSLGFRWNGFEEGFVLLFLL